LTVEDSQSRVQFAKLRVVSNRIFVKRTISSFCVPVIRALKIRFFLPSQQIDCTFIARLSLWGLLLGALHLPMCVSFSFSVGMAESYMKTGPVSNPDREAVGQRFLHTGELTSVLMVGVNRRGLTLRR
jgi:hypothetical protein